MTLRLDIRNTDLAYWDAILAGHELSEEQLDLVLPDPPDEDEQYKSEPEAEDTEASEEEREEGLEWLPNRHDARRFTSTNRDFEFLRTKLDSNDQFMSSGHQIKKIRGRERKNGEWALNDAKIRTLISSAFPKWRISKSQRNRAARWVRIIHLYYKMGTPLPMVAKELNAPESTVREILKGINRIIRGRRFDNRGLLAERPVSGTTTPPKRPV